MGMLRKPFPDRNAQDEKQQGKTEKLSMSSDNTRLHKEGPKNYGDRDDQYGSTYPSGRTAHVVCPDVE